MHYAPADFLSAWSEYAEDDNSGSGRYEPAEVIELPRLQLRERPARFKRRRRPEQRQSDKRKAV